MDLLAFKSSNFEWKAESAFKIYIVVCYASKIDEVMQVDGFHSVADFLLNFKICLREPADLLGVL